MFRPLLSVAVVLFCVFSLNAQLPVSSGTLSVHIDTSSYFGGAASHPEWSQDINLNGVQNVGAQLSLDVTQAHPTNHDEYQMIAQAEMFGTPGSALATGTGSSRHVAGAAVPFSSVAMVNSGAGIRYNMQVASSRSNPLGYHPPIFVTATVAGEAKVTTEGNGGLAAASLSVSIQGGNTQYEKTVFTATDAAHGIYLARKSLDESVHIELDMGYPYVTIDKSAGGRATPPHSIGVSEYQAVIDPIFTFDQAAFDAYALSQGFPTFPLADFYGLEFSEGIVVPEPRAMAMLLVVAPILLRASRRKCALRIWRE